MDTLVPAERKTRKLRENAPRVNPRGPPLPGRISGSATRLEGGLANRLSRKKLDAFSCGGTAGNAALSVRLFALRSGYLQAKPIPMNCYSECVDPAQVFG
jgi:hypothetical protein